MIKLLDLLKEVLQEGNNPFGKTAYHGSKYKFDLNSLDIDRVNLTRDITGRIVETASSQTGVGFYITPNLWPDNGEEWYSHIYNPIHKERTKGVSESAAKYAGSDIPAYIYQVELDNDINLEKYGYKNIDGRDVSKQQKEALLKEGIDGLYEDKSEAVILNKDKIKSIKLVYKAEEWMKEVKAVDVNKVKYRANFLSFDQYKNFEIQMEYIHIPPNTLDSYLTKILGGKYTILGNPKKPYYVASNIPEDYENSPSKYDITKYKFYTVKSGYQYWVKA
jgi:hypothetical protein